MGISISLSGVLRHDTKPFNDFFKRIFDIVFSAAVLIVSAPFFGLIALAIKRETPGPVFYRGSRVGRKGKCFKILKFRTMYETSESYAGPKVTAQDDERITPLGRWLRNTKLNEFPQFWNVLKGEMSLVGPRPEDPVFAGEWPKDVAQELLSVRPGITSPASVTYRDEESLLCSNNLIQKYLCDLTPTKIRLDQLYIRHRSLLLDIDTILWTVMLLVPLIRTYSPPEQLLIVGPVTRLIKRYLNWYLLDFFVLLTSIWGSVHLLSDITPLDVDWSTLMEMSIGYLIIYSLAAVRTEANLTRWEKATSRDAVRLVMAWAIATSVILVIHFALKLTSEFRMLILMSGIFFLMGILLARYRSRVLTGLLSRFTQDRPESGAEPERVLIVGSGRTAEHVLWLLTHPTYSAKYQAIGIVDDDPFSLGMNIYGVKVLGNKNDLAGILAENNVGMVILADHRMARSDYDELRDKVQNSPARIVVVPDIFGSMEGLTEFEPAETEESKNFTCNHCLARKRCRVDAQVE